MKIPQETVKIKKLLGLKESVPKYFNTCHTFKYKNTDISTYEIINLLFLFSKYVINKKIITGYKYLSCILTLNKNIVVAINAPVTQYLSSLLFLFENIMADNTHIAIITSVPINLYCIIPRKISWDYTI